MTPPCARRPDPCVDAWMASDKHRTFSSSCTHNKKFLKSCRGGCSNKFRVKDGHQTEESNDKVSKVSFGFLPAILYVGVRFFFLLNPAWPVSDEDFRVVLSCC